MGSAHWLLVFVTVLSVYNCGTIWPTQRVTYPLFEFVAPDQFMAYHRFYNRRITWIVIVPGFLSFLAPFVLTVLRPPSVPLWAAVLGAIFSGLALLVTVAREIPRHLRLQQQGKSDVLIRGLITDNWGRTLAITAQAVLMVWLLAHTFVPVSP